MSYDIFIYKVLDRNLYQNVERKEYNLNKKIKENLDDYHIINIISISTYDQNFFMMIQILMKMIQKMN